MNDAHHRLALPQGTRIQNFEFHRVLGQGGFGITYLGWNLALDIPVAIKEYFPSDLATREYDLSVVPQSSQAASDFEWGMDRFIDEARILARFHHPNIVRVHHFFEAHSTAYIVMEYAEGETLSAFLERKGTLKEAELKSILYPILDGLDVVHRADFLHRDIKPGNIIIRDEDNSPVLLDFGSARQAIGARSRSVTSIITPGYAPIEQYSSRGDQGPWTDIYALGGVCYRALTGEVPDDATDRMRNDPLIPVTERCAGQASAEFLSAIDWALQVDEGDRPQSIGAWRAELEVGSGEVQRREPITEPTVRGAPPQASKLTAERDKFVAEVGRAPSPDVVGDDSETDLHHVAVMNLSVLTISLLKQGAEVNAKDKYGNTPLHRAAFYNARETAEVLLNWGAEVNVKNKYSVTPLQRAVWQNDREMTEVLLNWGAEVNVKNKSGNTPLEDAVEPLGDPPKPSEQPPEPPRDVGSDSLSGHSRQGHSEEPVRPVNAEAPVTASATPPIEGGSDDASRLNKWFLWFWLGLLASIPLAVISYGVFSFIAIIVSLVCGCYILHKLWCLIPAHEAKTTPGRAVGFLFIPFFNLYWNFIAIYGLAQALNSQIRKRAIRNKGVGEGLSLIYCFLALINLLICFLALINLLKNSLNEASFLFGEPNLNFVLSYLLIGLLSGAFEPGIGLITTISIIIDFMLGIIILQQMKNTGIVLIENHNEDRIKR